MRSGGKAVARRASALLMSALLAFSTCPANAMAQEQDDGETESPVLLVDDANETTDEIGGLAQELPLSDPAEDDVPAEEKPQVEFVDEEDRTDEVTAEDDNAEGDEQSLSVMSDSTNYYFEKDSSDEYGETAKVKVYSVSKGTVTYNAATKTLRLNNVTCYSIEASHSLTIELVGTNAVTCSDSIEANGALTVTGTGILQSENSNSYVYWECTQFVLKSGTIKANINLCGPNYGSTTAKIRGGKVVGKISHWYSTGNFTVVMSGGAVSGSISCGTLTMSGGSVSGSISCGTLTMTGGSVSYKGTGSNDSTNVVDCVSLVMKGGSIKASKCESAIDCREMTMTGGSLYAEDCDRGIYANTSQNEKVAKVTVKKGKVVVTNPSHEGIYLPQGNLYIQGGAVTVKGAYEDAIEAYGRTYRGKRYGGKVKITGGKLVATTRQSKDSSYSAIYAESITNKPSCLKKIVGRLSTGARFKSGGNTYQVSDYYSDCVNVYRYGSKKTEAKFKQVTYGKYKYGVAGIAANAFNTKRGTELTSITFQSNYGIRTIGANAFKGTKSLRRLIFKSWFSGVNMNWNGSKYKLKVDKKYFKCNKKAFSGAGANGGSGLTVTMRGGTDQAHLYRNLLLSRGLPSSARVTTTYFNN